MATKPKMTVEEKLAAAETQVELWKSESRRLSGELQEAREDAALAAGRQMAERKRLEDVAKQWQDAGEKARKDALAETNGLRGIIRDLELAVERYRGYFDGVTDTQPSRMVPEERSNRRESWPSPSGEAFTLDTFGGSHGHGRAVPWWHK